MGTVQTKLDGVFFNEHLKQTAQVADKITVCRSMTHGEAAHERGTHNMFTGYRPSPAARSSRAWAASSPTNWASRNNLPPYVCIPSHADQLRRHRLPDLRLRPVQPGQRPGRRRLHASRISTCPAASTRKRFSQRRTACSTRSTSTSRARKRPTPRRDGHVLPAGLQPDQLARRPARRSTSTPSRPSSATNTAATPPASGCCWRGGWSRPGVRFVSLTYGGWDMHGGIKQRHARASCRRSIRRFAALIRDLDRSGLLDSTLDHGLVSEFGRTPKINGTAGRDHWPKVFSVVLAGGGIKKGFIYGSSDATATEPEDDPLTVEDLAMTVYHQLGINADKKLMAPGNRPIDIVREGKARKELLGVNIERPTRHRGHQR